MEYSINLNRVINMKTQFTSNNHRQDHLSALLSLALAFAMTACGMGSVGGDGVGDGLENRADNGTELRVSQQNGRAVVSLPESAAPVFWAGLTPQDAVIFGYGGSRYAYNEVGLASDVTISPEGPAGELVAGGQVAKGAQIGLPIQVQVDGNTVPHVLILTDASTATGAVTYSFSPCADATCTAGPVEPTSASVAADQWAALGTDLRLRARALTSGQLLFAIIRTTQGPTDEEPAADGGVDDGGTGGVDGGGGGGGTTVIVKHDDDDNDWWKYALVGIGAGVIGYVVGTHWDDWFGKSDTGTTSGAGAAVGATQDDAHERCIEDVYRCQNNLKGWQDEWYRDRLGGTENFLVDYDQCVERLKLCDLAADEPKPQGWTPPQQ